MNSLKVYLDACRHCLKCFICSQFHLFLPPCLLHKQIFHLTCKLSIILSYCVCISKKSALFYETHTVVNDHKLVMGIITNTKCVALNELNPIKVTSDNILFIKKMFFLSLIVY